MKTLKNYNWHVGHKRCKSKDWFNQKIKKITVGSLWLFRGREKRVERARRRASEQVWGFSFFRGRKWVRTVSQKTVKQFYEIWSYKLGEILAGITLSNLRPWWQPFQTMANAIYKAFIPLQSTKGLQSARYSVLPWNNRLFPQEYYYFSERHH